MLAVDCKWEVGVVKLLRGAAAFHVIVYSGTFRVVMSGNREKEMRGLYDRVKRYGVPGCWNKGRRIASSEIKRLLFVQRTVDPFPY